MSNHSSSYSNNGWCHHKSFTKARPPGAFQTDFPTGWDITFTENHWSNETVTTDYVYNILLPYIINS